MTDRIEIAGLRALGRHGVLDHERATAQPFEVDLEIEADLGRAAASDDLGDTVDYAAACAQVAAIIETGHFALLESLAGRICDAILELDGVTAVTASVRKLRPPVPYDVASTGVRLRRCRNR